MTRGEFLLAAGGAFAAAPDGMRVDAGFPGGNIVVHGIEGDAIVVSPDLRDTHGRWFYFNFRVRGAAGRTLTVRFRDWNPMTSRGPAVSVDAGATWRWLGADSVKGSEFRCAVPAESSEVRFCMTVPYLEPQLEAFLQRHRGHSNLSAGTLCRTPKGRDVEALRLGRIDGKCKQRALITARHHCCETMASYALEGLMDEILSRSEDGRWLCANVEVLTIPFMDKDGVEDGDQGKNRKPWDHNRDYVGDSVHASVAALRRHVPEWSGGLLRLAYDMHCPGNGGRCHELLYGIGANGTGSTNAEGQRFNRILEEIQTGPLRFHAEEYTPCLEEAKKWWSPPSSSPRKSFGQWSRELPGIRLSGGIEIPYAVASGREVTAESARALGHDLARTIRRYLAA